MSSCIKTIGSTSFLYISTRNILINIKSVITIQLVEAKLLNSESNVEAIFIKTNDEHCYLIADTRCVLHLDGSYHAYVDKELYSFLHKVFIKKKGTLV